MAKARWFTAIFLTLSLPATRASAEAAAQPEVKMLQLPGFEAPVPVRVVAEAPVTGNPAVEDPCADAGSRVDFLEAPIIDLKARYWAERLREGASLAELKEWPGLHLNARELRRRFVRKVKAYAAQAGRVGLSPDETERFLKADQAARRLERSCGAGEFRPAVRQANAAAAQARSGS